MAKQKSTKVELRGAEEKEKTKKVVNSFLPFYPQIL